MVRPIVGITTYVTPASWSYWQLDAALIPLNYVSELDIIPNDTEQPAAFTAALKSKLNDLSGVYPNLGFRKDSGSIRVTIPNELRVRGGSSFGQLVAQFLNYVRNPQSLPGWEAPNLLAKYYITTTAVRMAGQ